jgi:ATPase family protein associated with various cellular activities (AAA)
MNELRRAGLTIDAALARARVVLRRAVEDAKARRATAFDPVRGLYVTEAEVTDILSRDYPSPITAEADVSLMYAPGAVHDAIALAIAAEYLPRLDRVFGFLHDDLTRRTLTAGLLVEMLGLDPALLAPDGLLVRLAIFTLGTNDIPLAASVRIDRGFLAVLAGNVRLDARIRAVASEIARPATAAATKRAPRASPLVLWGASAGDIAAAAREMVADAGRAAVRLGAAAHLEHLGIAARDALLRDAVLLVESTDPATARAVAHAGGDLPVEIIIEACGGIVAYEGRARRVSPRAPSTARPPAGYPLPFGRRMPARRKLDDLILPAAQLRAVRSVADRMSKRDLVTREWGVDTGSSVGGVRALFAGPPGTGKTLAAEALANALGRDLYIVDVSLVVSKYIGETEKALATVFAEAERAGVCLFFDEADAFFGKRTEARDAHDRYANLETAYLLQALDVYPDVAILATNMVANIDDALVRRIDVKVEFPMPDATARQTLWRRALARAPVDGVDTGDLAIRLPLSGGGIQSAALAAAYRAASEDRPIIALDVIRAARDELAKTGRIAGRIELGNEYAELRAEERS